jgi:hypothetical protein
MIQQTAIQVKVVEDGVPVTGFPGAVVLERHARAMGFFRGRGAPPGVGEGAPPGRSAGTMLFDLMMVPCAGGSALTTWRRFARTRGFAAFWAAR